jgi:hypothetical protein
MITRINYTPEPMKYMSWIKQDYWELSDAKGIYGYTATRINPPECQFHWQVTRFSKSVLETINKDWPIMQEIIKINGGKLITVCYTQIEDKRMEKLLKRYGFAKPIPALISCKVLN